MKRGRKQNNDLPPSRSRDIQRAFRARRAQYIANLERRVAELESDNATLRNQLLSLGIDVPPPVASGEHTESSPDLTAAAGSASTPRSGEAYRDPGQQVGSSTSHAVPHQQQHGPSPSSWSSFQPDVAASSSNLSGAGEQQDIKPDLSTLSEVAAGKRRAPPDWHDITSASPPSHAAMLPPAYSSHPPHHHPEQQAPLAPALSRTPAPTNSSSSTGLPAFPPPFQHHHSFSHGQVNASSHLYYPPHQPGQPPGSSSGRIGNYEPPAPLPHRHSHPALHTFGWNTASPPLGSLHRYDGHHQAATLTPISGAASSYPSTAATPVSSPPSSSGSHLAPVWIGEGNSGPAGRGGRPTFAAIPGRQEEPPNHHRHQQHPADVQQHGLQPSPHQHHQQPPLAPSGYAPYHHHEPSPS